MPAVPVALSSSKYHPTHTYITMSARTRRQKAALAASGNESEESLWPFDGDEFIASFKTSHSRTHSSSPPLLLHELSRNIQVITTPVHDLPVSHSLHSDYMNSSDLSRPIIPTEQSIRPKKRRLAPAPAPPPSIHPDFGTDASRLYYDHLQMR